MIRNKLGVKSITASVEEVREAFDGSLEKLCLNINKTAFQSKASASWACPIMGELQVLDKNQELMD